MALETICSFRRVHLLLDSVSLKVWLRSDCCSVFRRWWIRLQSARSAPILRAVLKALSFFNMSLNATSAVRRFESRRPKTSTVNSTTYRACMHCEYVYCSNSSSVKTIDCCSFKSVRALRTALWIKLNLVSIGPLKRLLNLISLSNRSHRSGNSFYLQIRHEHASASHYLISDILEFGLPKFRNFEIYKRPKIPEFRNSEIPELQSLPEREPCGA